jgi:hypothetical protein
MVDAQSRKDGRVGDTSIHGETFTRQQGILVLVILGGEVTRRWVPENLGNVRSQELSGGSGVPR